MALHVAILATMLIAGSPVHYAVKGIPLVSYSSQVGVGYGLRVGLFAYEGDATEYSWNVYGQFYRTTGGVQKHRLFFDKKGRLRFTVTAEYNRALYENYYPLSLVDSGNVKPGDTAYTYIHTNRFVQAVTRHKVTYVMFNYQLHDVELRPGSVINSMKPQGWQGGKVAGLQFGIYWDKRDFEGDPSDGWLLEASYGIWGGDYHFTTLFLSATGYYSPLRSVTLAARTAYSRISDEAPFFMVGWNYSLRPFEGVGGRNSVRGYPTFYATAQNKLIMNTELRWRFLNFNFLGSEWTLGGVADLDIGYGFGQDVIGESWISDDVYEVSAVGYAAGLRLMWGRDFIIAADFGFSRGFSTIDITFDHAF